MKRIPSHSEKAIPVVNYKQLTALKDQGRIRECYKVNPDGSIAFDRFEPYDNK